MRRILLGIVLLLHGLAHANAGLLAAEGFRVTPTIVWAVASVSFLAAGFGLLGVRRLDRHWQVLGLAGVFASLLLLALYRPATAAAGIVVDVALLGVLGFAPIPHREWRARAGWMARIGQVVTFAFLAYVAVAILSRPWHARWGRFGRDLGWRIVRLEPERVLTLGGWGSFILEPPGADTRLIVRTRGNGKPNVPLAPFGVLVFEPAHFIMERGMLRGIKHRVEREEARTAPSAS